MQQSKYVAHPNCDFGATVRQAKGQIQVTEFSSEDITSPQAQIVSSSMVGWSGFERFVTPLFSVMRPRTAQLQPISQIRPERWRHIC